MWEGSRAMKLRWSPRSPFVRNVMIVAHETGLVGRMECVRTVVAATAPHAGLMRENPLSKLPTLALGNGMFDFRFAGEDWRRGCPGLAAWHEGFAARVSVRATEPVDDTDRPMEAPVLSSP